MIASLMLAAALAHAPVTPPATATIGVSLRIVDACDPAARSRACAPAEREQWLRQHARRRLLVDGAAAGPADAIARVHNGTVVEVTF